MGFWIATCAVLSMATLSAWSESGRGVPTRLRVLFLVVAILCGGGAIFAAATARSVASAMAEESLVLGYRIGFAEGRAGALPPTTETQP